MNYIKYYFFRDLDNEANLSDGMSYHAAGIVEKVFCEDFDTPTTNGKDFSVLFLLPFDGTIYRGWRAINEVELYEVDYYTYNYVVSNYDDIEKQHSISNSNYNKKV